MLLDKSPFCGGNSTKATSGINGAETKTQKAWGIKDSNELFISDTLKGGAKKPEVAKVLCTESGPVIFCSGGFGADFGQDSLLAKYRPDLLHLPTTNGEHCTGDAIKMGEGVGAGSIDLEWVQVHPTGLVKPDDPDAKVKSLAAEALRGVGGLVLDVN